MNETEPVRDCLPLKPVDFLVLAVLHDHPLHGYGIVQEIESRTGGHVSLRPGDVYRVLYRMRRQGLLEPHDPAPAGDEDSGASSSSDGEPRAEDGRRAYYRITDLGRVVAAAEAEMMREVARDVLGRRDAPTETVP